MKTVFYTMILASFKSVFINFRAHEHHERAWRTQRWQVALFSCGIILTSPPHFFHHVCLTASLLSFLEGAVFRVITRKTASFVSSSFKSLKSAVSNIQSLLLGVTCDKLANMSTSGWRCVNLICGRSPSPSSAPGCVVSMRNLLRVTEKSLLPKYNNVGNMTMANSAQQAMHLSLVGYILFLGCISIVMQTSLETKEKQII